MNGLSRRQFVQAAGIASLGLLAGCGRVASEARSSTKVPQVGYLGTGFGPSAGPDSIWSGFLQGIQDAGYVEGHSIILQSKWAEDHQERLADLAAELVHRNVDVIFAAGSNPARAAKRATSAIPIVFGASSDPVAQGLVRSLARPSENVTGTSLIAPTLSAKRLELLNESAPVLTRVGALATPTSPTLEINWEETQRAARTLGLELQRFDVQDLAEFDRAFSEMTAWRADGLIVLAADLFARHRPRLAELAAQHGLPSMYSSKEFAQAGGLVAYGPSVSDASRRAASYVDKILKGARPADLPVEQPREFDLVINLRTAQALGITIPRHVLLQATEVIQ